MLRWNVSGCSRSLQLTLDHLDDSIRTISGLSVQERSTDPDSLGPET